MGRIFIHMKLQYAPSLFLYFQDQCNIHTLSMGIRGLLQELKAGSRICTMEEFRGKTAGIDALCWLHRGAFSVAQEIALGRPCKKYISFCENLLDMLDHYNVTPIVVFDGKELPMKREMHLKRRVKRDEELQKGIELFDKKETEEALKYFQRSISVSNRMIEEFVGLLQQRKIEYIIAPYEADSQLGYLASKGVVNFCISEDSDLLLFGAHQVLYKMDRYGNGTLVDLDFIKNTFDVSKMDSKSGSFLQSLKRMSAEQIMNMCILSGCDYLESLPGMGLRSAQKAVLKFKSITHLIQITLSSSKCKLVDKEYAKKFKQAKECFMYQPVFDPQTKKVCYLNPLLEHESLAIDVSLAVDPNQYFNPKELASDLYIDEDFALLDENWNLQETENVTKTNINFSHRENPKPVFGTDDIRTPKKKMLKRETGAYGDTLKPLKSRKSADFIKQLKSSETSAVNTFSKFEVYQSPLKKHKPAQKKLFGFLRKSHQHPLD